MRPQRSQQFSKKGIWLREFTFWFEKESNMSYVVNVWYMILSIFFNQTKKCERAKAGAEEGERRKLVSSPCEAHSDALTVLPSSISMALVIRWRWLLFALVHSRFSWLERKKFEAPTYAVSGVFLESSAQDCCGCAAGLPPSSNSFFEAKLKTPSW